MTLNHKPRRHISIVGPCLQSATSSAVPVNQGEQQSSRRGKVMGSLEAACLTPTPGAVTLSRLPNSSVPQFPAGLLQGLAECWARSQSQ